MQKVLRQNILARNQHLKRARRENLQAFKKEKRDHDRAVVRVDRIIRENIKNERKNRREDWILGPLAPDRNVGEQKGIYGTADQHQYQGPEVPKRERDRLVNIVPGDRVVVVRGSCRGKIGKVKQVAAERKQVVVEGVNTADIPRPLWNPATESNKEKYMSTDLPIPLADVRLVIPMHSDDDPEKPLKDVVIRHLRGGGPYLDREYGSSTPRHTRYIAGLNIEVPWPDAEFRTFIAEPGDTKRFIVEEKTYVPVVVEPPLPPGVIDELRDKFNRRRGFHEHDWVAKKIVQDAKEAWAKQRKILTPKQEYWEMGRKQRTGQPSPQLSEETLQIIRETQRLNLKNTTQSELAAS